MKQSGDRELNEKQRLRLFVRGIVQGVGFRPFLHRLAKTHDVTGWVRNTGEGLEGELEGDRNSLSAFLHALQNSPPPLADIEQIDTRDSSGDCTNAGTFQHFTDFQILASGVTPFDTLVSPDIALCPDCRNELFSPVDRRYRYPFVNCTNCGPRYTIVNGLPYDRNRTVMKHFPMCSACQEEYGDIDDRRYHAQPDCCPDCGPEAFYLDGDGTRLPGDPFSLAQNTLVAGGILAVKGTGGIHLACDARNHSAVAKLREKKHRPHKPFGLMCRSLETARSLCHISKEEAELLSGARRPIVLLSKKYSADPLAPAIEDASGVSPRIGLMLPYTPLHELLMDGTFGGPDLIVLTSANLPGCPVFTENDDAIRALSGIADGFLLHNRPIANRCDDSLVSLWNGQPYFFRRSRGYAPAPLVSERDMTGIFAMGAEQKASFALGRGRHIFLSPHIGDLKNAETLEHYQTALETYRHLFGLNASVYVCDLHPDYLSGKEARASAQRDNVPILAVQHHWAHMVSCMEDNQLSGRAFGIIWDGTGLAPDHSIWGGEWLAGDSSSYERIGSIRPVRLIGGDRATKEIGRIGLSLLAETGMSENELYECGLSPYSSEQLQQLLALLSTSFTVNASSIGRLFDGVCSLLCQKAEADYEGEGAVLLESLSPREEPDFSHTDGEKDSYPRNYYEKDSLRVWDTRPLIRGICADIFGGKTAGEIAFRFLTTLCFVARDQTVALNRDQYPVVLSGGVFQNRFLLSGVTQLLEQAGFTIYSHKRAATNDEGICLGQLAIARAAFPDLFSHTQ